MVSGKQLSMRKRTAVSITSSYILIKRNQLKEVMQKCWMWLRICCLASGHKIETFRRCNYWRILNLSLIPKVRTLSLRVCIIYFNHFTFWDPATISRIEQGMGNCPPFRDHASHGIADYFDLIGNRFIGSAIGLSIGEKSFLSWR